MFHVRSHNRFRRAVSFATATALALTLLWTGSPASAGTENVAPPSPENLTYTISNNTNVKLNWTQPTSQETIQYYQIFRVYGGGALNADEVTYIGQSAGNARTFTDTVQKEGWYWYAVMSVDDNADASIPSNWIEVEVDLGTSGITEDTTAPNAPTNLRFLVGTTTVSNTLYTNADEVKLSWTASTSNDVKRYLVYRALDNQAFEPLAYVPANTTSYVDEALDGDGQYEYYVVAQDQVGNLSPDSNIRIAHVDTVAPEIEITYPADGEYVATSGSMTVEFATMPADDWTTAKYFIDAETQGRTSATINLGGLSQGWHTLRVEAKDQAGNWGEATALFHVGGTTGTLSAPRSLNAGSQYSTTRSISLTWLEPTTGVTSSTVYKLYRSLNNGTPQLVKTTENTSVTDQVNADGTYTYFVVAQNGSVTSPISNKDTVTVDIAAPTITISAPKNGTTYKKTGTLTPAYAITDATSGYDPEAVDLFLNDNQLDVGASIDLAALETNRNHTFTVWVMDRAGNVAEKSVTFRVSATATNPEDDDDDDDDDANDAGDAMELLMRLQAKIHHGHFVSLMAKLRAGNISGASKHIQQHRGKFISPDAADQLLQALGALEGDDHYDDDAGWSWAPPGQKKKK